MSIPAEGVRDFNDNGQEGDIVWASQLHTLRNTDVPALQHTQETLTR